VLLSIHVDKPAFVEDSHAIAKLLVCFPVHKQLIDIGQVVRSDLDAAAVHFPAALDREMRRPHQLEHPALRGERKKKEEQEKKRKKKRKKRGRKIKNTQTRI
jgi:hypothetical protein